jgi:uncharacterized protein involved in exopolysaccharide biosynthesis
MPESDSRDRDRRRGSLLTLAIPTARQQPEAEPVRARDESAIKRHHLARSRREAAPSPLIAALAKPAAREAEDSFAASNKALEDIFSAEPESPAVRSTEPAPQPAKAREATVERHEVADEPARPATDGGDPYWRPLIDPMAVIGGINRSRGIIAATTILGAALGAMIALSTPKMYVARAELLVDPRDIRVSERELTAGGLSSDATLAVVENQVRVMMSGSVMNQVVDRLGLERDPEFNGEAKSAGIGSIVSRLRSLISSGGAGEGADKRNALAVENLYRAVDAERGGRTFVISVRAKTESPDKSALIVNTLTEVFLSTYGSIQAGTAGRASDELTGRLSELRSNLEEAERRIEAYKSENDLVDAQGRLITDDEMVKLNDQLGAARARTLELDARAASAREVTVEAALAGNLPEQINSPVLTELRSQYALLSRDFDRASTRLGPRHPERISLETQLSSARQQIQQEIRLVASSLQVELRRAVQLEQELAARLAQLKARQSSISEELVTLRELERDANAKRAVYEAFLLRARETGEQRDLNTANMAVISQATPPLLPTGMSRTMMTLVSAMMGFGAGVGIGAARGAWDGLRTGPSPAAPAPAPARAAPAPASPRRREAEPEGDNAPPTEPIPAQPAPATSAAETRSETPVPDKPETAHAAETAEEASMHHAPVHPNWPIRTSLADGQREDSYGQQRQAAPQPQWPAAGSYPQQQPYPGHATPQGYAPYPPQPYPYPVQPMQAYPGQGYAGQGYAEPYPRGPEMVPQGYYPQPAPYQGQPYQGQPYPGQQGWAPMAPQQQAWPQPPQPEQPQRHEAAQPAAPARSEAETSAIDEIRESLREFREALRELAESRTRRRFL